MRKGIVLLAIAIGVGLLAPAPGALAKGPPAKVVISGPGLEKELELTDAKTMNVLGMATFEDVETVAYPEATLTSVYVITRYFRDGGVYRPFDQVLYAVGNSRTQGYVYYVGIYNGWGPYDNKWFATHRDSEDVLRNVLIKNGAKLTPLPKQR